MTSSLEIRLIGELEVLRDGTALALPASRKSRALLAYLVATPRPNLRDRLCELLWEGPDDPRAALRWSLTKLRPIIDGDGAQRLVADRDRITFTPCGALIDLSEVRDLTARGVGAMTTDDLQRAAKTIRGELLEGLELANCYRYQQWCAGEREALRQLHIRILGRLVDVLPAGDEALAYARRRAEVDPFNEEAHIALIRLLASMDRSHDALRHYDECRLLFERELGCRPSNAIEDARRSVGRSQQAKPIAPPPAPAAEGKQTTYVGRARELAAADEVVQRAIDERRGSMIVVAGEPGIGKSRLLAEIARRVGSRGVAALYGRAFAAEMIRPYGVWVDALRQVAAEAGEDVRRDLAPLFPEMGSAAGHDRARLFDAVTRLLAGVAAERGAVLALDDLQWFDEASVALLHFVERATKEIPLVIVCAARSGELQDNTAAWRVVRETKPLEIELRPLTSEEARALARSVSADADLDRVSAESGGNPLFAIELARTPQSHHGTLMEIIGERLTQLDARSSELVPWAAALGRHFDVEILGRATGMPSGEMLAALERLERASVLRVSTTGSDRCYDFTHDLIREAAYQRISGPRRWVVHRQTARALQSMHDADGALAGEIVHHAALAGENELAATAAVTAGHRCLRLFAYGEAVAVANHGLELAALLPDAARLPLQVELMHVNVLCRMSLSNTRRELIPRLEALTEEARKAGLTRTAILGSHLLAILHEENESFDDAANATIRSAEMSRGGDPATEMLAVATTARCLLLIQRDVDRAAELAHDAQLLSVRSGVDNPELTLALGFLHAHRGEYDRAAHFLERALDLAAREQDHWREWIAISRLAMIALEQGDAATALLHCQRLQPITAKMTGGSEGPRADALQALASLVAGQREDIAGALEVLRRIDSKGDLAYALNFIARRHADRGEAGAAEAAAGEALTAAEAVDRRSEAALARATLSELLAKKGQTKSARSMLAPALDETRWPDLTTRAQEVVLRCASKLKRKERTHGNHGRRTVL